jgi:hypothetical protein
MEIVILIGILLVIWYYGTTIKDAIETNNQKVDNHLSTISNSNFEYLGRHLVEIRDNLFDIGNNIDDIRQSVQADWQKIESERSSQVLKKLNDISAMSVEVRELSDRLERISSSVNSIAAHPEFTRYLT